MPTVKCSTCGDTMEGREMRACKSCGAFVCPACSAGNHELCNFCYSDLSYLN